MRTFLLLINLLVCFVANAQTWIPISFVVDTQTCQTTNTELYISEVYDSQNFTYAVIEIFNPSNSPINLNNYSLRRRTDYGTGGWNWTQPLSGTLAAKDTYVIVIDGATNNCDVVADLPLSASYGINANDQIQLLKSGGTIDDVRCPNVNGYTVRRLTNVVAPKNVYVSGDWHVANFGSQDCSDIGSVTLNVKSVERLVSEPTFTLCDFPARIRILVEGGSGQYERSVNGGAFENHVSPWFFDLNTGGNITVTIRNKIEPTCLISISFYIDPNPIPITSSVVPL